VRSDSAFAWLAERYGLGDGSGSADNGAVPPLPPGQGAAPLLDEVAQAFLAMPRGAAMAAADWHTVASELGEDAFPSASEVFAEVERQALAAARGHGAVALDFLQQRTAWGRGEVDDSHEPMRYAKRSWVARDLARIAGKRPGAAQFFEPVPRAAETKPVEHTIKRRTGLLQRLYDFMAEPGGYEFLVHNLIPRVGLGQFYGDSGTGKTPFILSLALHVAFPQLTHWFGHDVDVHGTVVYMIGEGREGLKKRIAGELRQHGITLEPDSPFVVTTRPGQLCDADDAGRWLQAIKELCPQGIALLVVDTLGQNFGPGNESATDDMNRFVQHLTALTRQLRCCAIPTHHMGHGDKTRARGSSVWLPALDFSFQVTKHGTLGAIATADKAKDWTMPEPLRANLEVVTVGQDEKGRDVTTVVLRGLPTGLEAVRLEDRRARDLELSEVLTDEVLGALLTAARTLHDASTKRQKGGWFSVRQMLALAALPRSDRAVAAVARAEELGLIKTASRPQVTRAKRVGDKNTLPSVSLTEAGLAVTA
jgi:hypothetical protein